MAQGKQCTCDWVTFSQHKISVRVPRTACVVHAEEDQANYVDEFTELERDRDE